MHDETVHIDVSRASSEFRCLHEQLLALGYTWVHTVETERKSASDVYRHNTGKIVVDHNPSKRINVRVAVSSVRKQLE
jgi:hypothetical protein